MSDRDRQRRLHIQNRLEELNAKHGPVDDELPEWLDHMPEGQSAAIRGNSRQSAAPKEPKEPPKQPKQEPPRPHQPGRPPRTADW